MTRKKNKNEMWGDDEIVFGETTGADLEQLCYAFLSARIHNKINNVVPGCYLHSNKGGLWSEEFREFEKKKFGLVTEENLLEGYNTDI